jgi:hypothetical protein
MLWPVILPIQITVVLIVAVVGLVTALAPRWKWKRLRVLMVSLLCGSLAFVPTCMGIAVIVDSWRFGLFHYATFSEVRDVRIERFLPPMATNIALDKYASGHRARYSIREPDLVAYVDEMWSKHSRMTKVAASKRDPERPLTSSERDWFQHDFERLGWTVSESTVVLAGPHAANGAGASYYYDRRAGLAYHRAGYW